MVKSFLRYLVSFGLLFLVALYAHRALLASTSAIPSFSLLEVYAFHAVFSFSICALLSVFARFRGLVAQIGFLYLGGFLLKFFLFALIFQDIVLREKALAVADAVSLLVPMALFLGLEVYFIAKILRLTDAPQK